MYRANKADPAATMGPPLQEDNTELIDQPDGPGQIAIGDMAVHRESSLSVLPWLV